MILNEHIKKVIRHSLITLPVLALGNILHAQVILPKILGNNMVLQREKNVPVWGWASANEHITVKFNNQVKETVTDASGHWLVMLDPLAASDKPREMVISGTNTITLSNILVGEVWLCSGQSNMEYSMRKNSKFIQYFKGEKQPEDELKTADNPDIRIFLVNRKFMKPDPAHKGWNLAKDSALRPFSAVGYFFAKELYKALHVPIGMISSAVSGSNIEPWISQEAFYSSPYFKETDTTKR
ncbi:MAG TPA: sialate O-acetylesterase, partial [Bacteroidales bacterium]